MLYLHASEIYCKKEYVVPLIILVASGFKINMTTFFKRNICAKGIFLKFQEWNYSSDNTKLGESKFSPILKAVMVNNNYFNKGEANLPSSWNDISYNIMTTQSISTETQIYTEGTKIKILDTLLISLWLTGLWCLYYHI